MLTRILDLSVRHPWPVVGVWFIVAGLGAVSLGRLPFDAFPDTAPVQVAVNTPAPAFGPLDVERQISFPVEQAIGGLPGLAEVRSISKHGLSQVVATFDDDTDLYLARQVVQERLATVVVPPGVDRPALGPATSGLGEVFHYVVRGRGPSLAALREAQDWIIRPALRSVPGVAEVTTWGGHDRQLHVVVDPIRLEQHGVTLGELVRAVEEGAGTTGGGVIAQGGAHLVRADALFRSADDVRSVVLREAEGVPLLVGQVAEVRDGHEIRRGAVTEGGRGEAVLGLGFALTGANSREVTQGLKARLLAVEKALPVGIRADVVYDRTDVIDAVLDTVRKNLSEGALLVIAVLFVFLGSIRAGLIVALAIPLSMLVAFDLMLRAGVAGTLMSLGAIDFGLLVDSAVIQVENASRRLEENEGAAARQDPVQVVRDAAVEVRRPTLFGELVILAVYLPILTLTGVEGKLFRPMALTVLFALGASLVLSLTLIPALCRLVLPHRRHRRAPTSPWLARKLGALYLRALTAALRGKGWVLVAAVLVLVNGAFLATRLGTEFIPRLSEGAIAINTVRLASVSLEDSVRYGTQVERALLGLFPDEVGRVWTRTGSADIATDPMGVEVSDLYITLRPRERWKRAKTQEDLVMQMEGALSSLPGMRLVFSQPIEMRLNEMTAGGVRADLGVKVTGDDLEVLETKAGQIADLLRSIPGATDVAPSTINTTVTLDVTLDRSRASRHGVRARDVLDTVGALGTTRVGTLFEGERRFPVAVTLDDTYRAHTDRVGRLLVSTPEGRAVPLASVAEVQKRESPATVEREWGRRRTLVEANVRGRDLGSFVEEAQARIAAEIALPAGYLVTYGGQHEHYQHARQRLVVVVPLALLLVFALLYLTYRRLSDALRVFTGVPFAMCGGVLALWLRDIPFSISAAVGFIALSGVAVLGDMVLVSTLRQRLAAGEALETAVTGAAERRLRPVLMTALVAGVGFLPMALNTGVGAEVQRPLATVVVGGMVTATLLTLFVLPALYLVLGARRGEAEPGA